ncbi:MAG: hypothetical protein E7631_00415 [Ruminococcaceae bacterium]|nr:hypothetical protein [Oscillospiraceae bacterium]
MKRKLAACIGFLLAVLLLPGCTADDGTTPPVPETDLPAVEPVTAERLVGRYRGADRENHADGDIYLEIYRIDDLLIAEARETYAAYWAMELVPLPGQDPFGTAADTVQVTAWTFSGFSGMGAYWPDTETYTLHITDTGLDITDAAGETESYIRDDTLEPQHTPERYREALDGACPVGIRGEWTAAAEDGADIFLRLDEDGTILCLYKREGEPVSVHIGLAACGEEEGSLSCITERIGWADMPWFDTILFSTETDGGLLLKTPDTCGLLPPGQEIHLRRADGQT